MPVVLGADSFSITETANTRRYDTYLRDTVGTTNNLVSEPTVSTANIDIAFASGGSSHTIFLDTAGKVYSTGLNTSGQLGLGDLTQRTTPVPIPYFNNIPIASVSAGNGHTIFLDIYGKVYAVGDNGFGQLGLGTTTDISTPVPIPYFNNISIKSINIGANHTVFLDTAGKVYSCGRFASGRLGLGDITNNILTPTPIPYFNNIQITSVFLGYSNTTFFLDITGKLYGVGANSNGQLGLGTTVDISTPAPIPYFDTIRIASVYTGGAYTIFLDTSGKVYSTGLNTSGQLGLGDLTQRTTPVLISYFNNIPISSVSGGESHAIFLDTIGKVYSTGFNTNGQLGVGDTTNRTTPTLIPYFNTIPIFSVCEGEEHTLFIDTTGKVYSVGLNTNGQLGLGATLTDRLTPEIIPYFNPTPTAVTATVDGTLANHKLFTLTTAGYYRLTFPAFTIVNINNGTDIALNGNYTAIISTTRSSVLPTVGNVLTTVGMSTATGVISIVIRYHLRIPTRIPKQFNIETVKTPLYLRDTVGSTSNLTIEPTITSTATPQLTPEILYFKHKRGTNTQESYTITFNRDTLCDILIVGGGGASGSTGAWYEAGAGGGGGVVYMVNKVLNGTYTILVGNGGDNSNGGDSEIRNASTNTAIVFDSISLIGKGGGRGGNGTGTLSTSVGLAGGSGGGNAMYTNIAAGLATQGNTFWDGTQYVQGGFNGGQGNQSGAPAAHSGAGGGAGAVGNLISGGNGRLVPITGFNQFYGGGGASYGGNGTGYSVSVHTGGLGGGGKASGTTFGEKGTNDLGGGGGACTSSTNNVRVKGGSGIVIIRAYNKVIDKNILTFRHSEQNVAQTPHSLTFTKNTVCDVLVVGGGGGGGGAGGSGGGGAVVTFNDVTFPSGVYTILIGYGGDKSPNNNGINGFNGNNSSIEGNGIVLRAAGGGGGGQYNNNSAPTPPSITYTNPLTNATATSQGGGGGVRFASIPYAHDVALSGRGGVCPDNNAQTGGAGGGAASEANGGRGGNSSISSGIGILGNGGLGIVSSISGLPKEYGSGGAGAQWNQGFTTTIYGISTGGGGYSEIKDINNKNYPSLQYHGMKGSGGGGSGYTIGGSGIIILKIKSVIEAFYHTPHIKDLNNVINSIYYPSIPADATNLIGWFKFDGNSNDTNPTAVKNHFTTSSGTIRYGTDAIINKQFLDLANGSLVNTTLKINNRPFTISFLLRLYNSEAAYFLYQSSAATTNNALHIGSRGECAYTFDFMNNGLEAGRQYREDYNNWIFMVHTLEPNNNRKMYRNGILISSDANTAALVGTGNLELKSLRVDLCDMRVYDKALSQQEVTALYDGYMANTFTVNFPTKTIVTLNNNPDEAIDGTYNISVGATASSMINTTSTTFQENLYFNSSNIAINYHLRNPIVDSIGAQWTYSTSNANVYHLGNVGVGTTNPRNALEVIGNTHSTTYSAGKKTFKIEHPLKIKKWLYHGCIEGPRFDNIYRGKKVITGGKVEVDIDTECNTTGGMTPGTFTALNTNYQLYLQNNQTYDVVKGVINGSTISIDCENTIDDIEIDWLVVGERHDEHVINTSLTDGDGNLICEHNMPGYVDVNTNTNTSYVNPESENIPVTNVDITDEGITDVEA